MRQVVVLDWRPVTYGEMPDVEGTYLVAFSDGTVESWPMSMQEINAGEVRTSLITGMYWAHPIPHPDP
jgi:hypothetical protein